MKKLLIALCETNSLCNIHTRVSLHSLVKIDEIKDGCVFCSHEPSEYEKKKGTCVEYCITLFDIVCVDYFKMIN
jgi:hypothetical protein